MTHPRILFLDFDGVLNSEAFMQRSEDARDAFIEIHAAASVYEERHMRMIDPAAVALLNDLLERTGAKVCVSSTWRKLFTVPELQGMLRAKGFRGQLIGRTPDFWSKRSTGYAQRGHEIQYWIDRHKRYAIEQFVILDDDSDMAHLRHRLVQTTTAKGLEVEHVERAVKMLGGTDGPL